jgi:hypothetical protein
MIKNFQLLLKNALVVLTFHSTSIAQESYGKTLNLGVGVGGNYGYYRYVGNSLPIINVNYEFDAAKNFTLAPFVNVHSYSRARRWENRDYYYRETGFSIGLKGTYYFDSWVNARPKWDFYFAGSAGFMAVLSRWDAGYTGDKDYYRGHRPLFLDFHLGAQYQASNRLGIFLDLSTGVSTLGIAIRGKK